MTLIGAVKSLADPLRDTPVLLALLFFCLLYWIALSAGLLGLWLLLLVSPAFVRYLVQIVEARALRRPIPPVTADFFNLADSLWRLFPLVPVVLGSALYIAGADAFPLAGELLLAAGALFMPLSLALLAVTRSPLRSIDPVAAFRLLRRLGLDYLLAPFAVVAGGALLNWLAFVGTGRLLQTGLTLYWLTAVCSLTGRIVASIDMRAEIEIEAPVEATPEAVAASETRERQAVLNHAYGLISRDNRQGGFAHLADHASRHDDPLAAELWFFEAMSGWENRDAALFYAQGLLGHLLDAGRDIDAMKLMARCLRENPRFRPAEGDRERLLDAADRLGNTDVAASLGRQGR